MQKVVIVGGSLAGASAAATLRQEGFDGQVVVIGAETHLPYARPPLSKGYLRGEAARAFLHPAEFYATNEIELRLGIRATSVDPQTHSVSLDDGDRVPYDKLLIATGGRNRRLPIPGADLDGVFDLRTFEDADRIREHLVAGRKAVVAGMGFIGSEVSASLRSAGVDVVAIDGARAPLARVLGEQVGKVIEGLHRDNGVKMYFDDAIAEFEGADRVERVITKAGRSIECDFVVTGFGTEPVTDLVAGSGIAVDNGIVVDELCRTNVEDVYAAGDVANHYHPVFERRIRVEHFHNARKQGASAAKNMLGQCASYDEVPWFWSDQYDQTLQYAGFHTEWDELIVRGSLDRRDFIGFYLKDGITIASVGIGRAKQIADSKSLIGSRVTVDPSLLSDESIAMRDLMASSV